MCNKFVKSGKEYRLLGNAEATSLGRGVYKLCFVNMEGFHLEHMYDEFELPDKVYDINREVIDRTLASYKRLGKVGAAFCGLKGTGKTVTAKIIANRSELPVVVVPNCANAEIITNYLSDFDFPHVLFFDEFEKEFNDLKGGQDAILSFLDGTNNNKALTLITSNSEDKINENMKGRPSRIRYFIKYNSLSGEAIKEIINDCLIEDDPDKKAKAYVEIRDYVKTLKYVTIDILRSLIDEYNIYGDLGFINVDRCITKYYIGEIKERNAMQLVLNNLDLFKGLDKTSIFDKLNSFRNSLKDMHNSEKSDKLVEKALAGGCNIFGFKNVPEIFIKDMYHGVNYDAYRCMVRFNGGIKAESIKVGDTITYAYDDSDENDFYGIVKTKLTENMLIVENSNGDENIIVLGNSIGSTNLTYGGLL